MVSGSETSTSETFTTSSVGWDVHREFIAIHDASTDIVSQVFVPTGGSFGYIIPVAAQPTIDPTPFPASDFEQLDQNTRPRITVETITTRTVRVPGPEGSGSPGCCCADGAAKGGGSSGSSSTSQDAGVVDTGIRTGPPVTVGPVTATPLDASDATALDQWLTAHGFVIPAQEVGLVNRYVDAGRWFIVLTPAPGTLTQPDAGAGAGGETGDGGIDEPDGGGEPDAGAKGGDAGPALDAGPVADAGPLADAGTTVDAGAATGVDGGISLGIHFSVPVQMREYDLQLGQLGAAAQQLAFTVFISDQTYIGPAGVTQLTVPQLYQKVASDAAPPSYPTLMASAVETYDGQAWVCENELDASSLPASFANLTDSTHATVTRSSTIIDLGSLTYDTQFSAPGPVGVANTFTFQIQNSTSSFLELWRLNKGKGMPRAMASMAVLGLYLFLRRREET